MIRLTDDGDQIEVRFYHRFCGPHEIHGVTGVSVDEFRQCSIVEITINDDQFLYKGMAICHPTDNFCRARGRKLALAHCLRPFTKRFRTAIWNEYKTRCNL